MMKLEEAQQKAKEAIIKMAQEKIAEGHPYEEVEIFFLIRDGLGDSPLDVFKLEEYDDCYGVDIHS